MKLCSFRGHDVLHTLLARFVITNNTLVQGSSREPLSEVLLDKAATVETLSALGCSSFASEDFITCKMALVLVLLAAGNTKMRLLQNVLESSDSAETSNESDDDDIVLRVACDES